MSTDFQKGESEKDSLVGENTQLETTTNKTADSNCHKRVSLQPYNPTRLEYACVKCAWYVIAFFFVSTTIEIANSNSSLLNFFNFISLIPEWLLQTIFESLFIAVFIVLINVNKHRWGLKGINRCLLTLVYARAVGVLCVVLVGATDVGPFWTKILLIVQMAAEVVAWIANIATAIIVLCKTRDLMFGILMLISTIASIVSNIYTVYCIVNTPMILWELGLVDPQLSFWLNVIATAKFFVQLLFLNSIKEDIFK